MTLLEQAKTHPVRHRAERKITKEHIELAIAWARDEITYSQLKHVLGFQSGNNNSTQVYLFLAMALREAVKKS